MSKRTSDKEVLRGLANRLLHSVVRNGEPKKAHRMNARHRKNTANDSRCAQPSPLSANSHGHRNADRPNSFEPRLRKRGSKNYDRMMKSRHSTSLTKWRQRVGAEKLVAMLEEPMTNAVTRKEMAQVMSTRRFTKRTSLTRQTRSRRRQLLLSHKKARSKQRPLHAILNRMEFLRIMYPRSLDEPSNLFIKSRSLARWAGTAPELG